MVSRGLANEQNPTRDRLKFVWDRAAFTNYVSLTVGDGPRTRPKPAMWADAKRDFLPAVSKLAPKGVFALGTKMWGMMPDADIYITDDVQGYRLGGGEIMMCCAMSHPAGGSSWRKLASATHFTYQLELAG
jgi:hypothetical protein